MRLYIYAIARVLVCMRTRARMHAHVCVRVHVFARTERPLTGHGAQSAEDAAAPRDTDHGADEDDDDDGDDDDEKKHLQWQTVVTRSGRRAVDKSYP